MNLTQLDKAIVPMLMAGKTLEIRSSPGRGKSEFTKSLPGKMEKLTGKKWGFASCFLATMTPTDLMGYMVPIKDEHGHVLSQFSLPSWFQTSNPETGYLDGKLASDFEHGILFLDEFGQGESDVKRASAELMLNKQLGPHRLPNGWMVIAASNFANDRSGVTKDFDFLINRRTILEISDDLQSWENWAFSHGVNPVLIAFANQNSQVVFSAGVPDKQGPWCTPRSLVTLGKIFEHMKDANGDLPVDSSAVEIAHGTIGAGASAQLFAMIKLGQQMPKFDDIVASPMNAMLPKAPDAQMLVCYRLAAAVNDKNVDPVVTYMERMPKEFSVTFAKAAVRRDNELVNTEAFGKWCTRNATLMSALRDINP